MADEDGPRASWRDLAPIVRPHRRVLVVCAVLSLLAAAAGLAQPLAARAVIEALAEEGSVLRPVALLGVLVLVGALVGGVNLWLLERTAERIVLGARQRLVAQVLRLRVPVHDRLPSGDLLSRVTSDTTLLRAVTTTGIIEALTASVTIVGALVLMAYIDWPLLLATVGVLAAVLFVVTVVLPRIQRATKRAQEAVGDMGSRLERALGAVRTVKASGAEDREIAAVSVAATAAYRAGLRNARYQAVVGVTSGLAVEVAFLVVLGVGGARVADGDLSVASLIAFLLYLFYLAAPIGQLTQAATQLQQGLAALARLQEVDQLPAEADVGPVDEPLPAGRGEALVELEGVTLRYAPDRPPALDGVTLRLPRGGQTAIVGPSGAGKTSLFALLERFYDPDEGTIRLEGRPLDEIPRAQLRREIGYVEQEAPVFAGTLRENVRYAAPDASEDELREVLTEARLDQLVARLPDGLDTAVGERGTTLSGGERQRVAIARALLRRPRLLLLDEATSQLDAVNEQALRDTIARAATRCTVLVIAHRLSTVVAADRIVVLEAGRVRAIGGHDELVERDALYRALAQTQLLTR